MDNQFKKKGILLCITFLSLHISSCKMGSTPAVNPTTQFQQVDWEFIQSVGGMAIGDPSFNPRTFDLTIPLIQDFSGLRKITVEPTLRGSGLTCAAIRGSISWNGLVTNINIEAWAVDVNRVPESYPIGCDEVKMKILPFQRVPLSNSRVMFRDWMRGPAIHLVGSFSL